MPKAHEIVLFGSSIFIAGIKAAMTSAKLAPEHIQGNDPNAEQTLRQMNPRVILFDIACEPPAWLAALLFTDPSLVLIGLDPNCNYASVLSSSQPALVNMLDLTELTLSELHKTGPADPASFLPRRMS